MGRLFDAVHSRVSAMDAARFYGLRFGRSGRAVCPWHDDSRPDLAFYDDGARCYCFACHNGGDAIALTAQLFALTPLEAARKLGKDFALDVDDRGYTPPAGPSKAEQRRAERERFNRRFSDLCEVERAARQALENGPADWDSPSFRQNLRAYAMACDELENMQNDERRRP